jgi:hypothetical protein
MLATQPQDTNIYLPKLKVCAKCEKKLSIDSFYLDDYKRVDGTIVLFPYGYCKPCHNERTTAIRNAEREKWLAYHSSYNKTYKRKSRAGQKKKKVKNTNMVRKRNNLPLYVIKPKLRYATTSILTKLFQFLQSPERNMWLENKTVKLYVRKTKRLIEGQMVDFIDLASMSLKDEKDMGQGFFHHFLTRLLKVYPARNFFIENILNDRIPKHLIEFGFNYQNNNIEQPCMYLIRN